MVRKDGERKGKLVPKAEGPYLVSEFTDDSKNITVIEDANGAKWTKRVWQTLVSGSEQHHTVGNVTRPGVSRDVSCTALC